ncbi:unnamed protein product [Gadus morhua 'NCC']
MDLSQLTCTKGRTSRSVTSSQVRSKTRLRPDPPDPSSACSRPAMLALKEAASVKTSGKSGHAPRAQCVEIREDSELLHLGAPSETASPRVMGASTRLSVLTCGRGVREQRVRPERV